MKNANHGGGDEVSKVEDSLAQKVQLFSAHIVSEFRAMLSDNSNFLISHNIDLIY